ncbi:MAG: hypothetical protein ACK46X_17905, partial [Candidatus Sericytochromatia bacterium]
DSALLAADGQTTTYAYDPDRRWIAVQNVHSSDTTYIDGAGRATRQVTVLNGRMGASSKSGRGRRLVYQVSRRRR